MSAPQKDWLVRTRSGELLGPFNQKELLEQLAHRTFSPEDEIAESGGHPWISASLLQNRDQDELTNTSTRSTSTQSLTSALTLEDTQEGDFSTSSKSRVLDSDELTPTPEASSRVSSPIIASQPPTIRSSQRPFWVSILTVVIVSLLVVTIFMSRSLSKKEAVLISRPSFTMGDAESDFTRKIYQLIQSGETGTALKSLTDYHEKTTKKESLDYLIPYAALLVMEGESIPRAKKFLEQVLSSQASQQLKARAHHWLGYLLLSLEEGDKGEGHFLESLQLNPKDAASRFNLGRSYLKQEKYSQALDYLQLAELEVPDLWLIHIYKGRAKMALGQTEEARQSFKRALQEAPDRWMSYVYYSLFLMAIQEPVEARLVLKKMLTKDPQFEIHSPPPFGYYQERLNYNEYLSAFNQVMEKAPFEDREIGKNYITYLLQGGSDDDLRRFEMLSKGGSLTAAVLGVKIGLERKTKNEVIEEHLKGLPQNLSQFGPYAYVLRGEAKLRLGNTAGAMEDFQSALKLDPQSAISHWALASLFEKKGQKQEAKAEIERLLSLHPNYIPAVLSSRLYY